jgi:AcrR family transcriptional regulator
MQRPRDRQTKGAQKAGRASRVVNTVLHATCEELNRVGYGELSIEEVAARAGVNKTTIYRRWPTKSGLVTSAIQLYYDEAQDIPDTGTLKQDLLGYAAFLISRTQNPIARGAMLALNSSTDPALQPLAKKLQGDARRVRTEIVRRAVDRGELPENSDCALIGDLFSAPILRKLLTLNEKVSAGYIESVIDIVIAGATAVSTNKRSTTRRTSRFT